MIKLVSLKLENFKQYRNAHIIFPEQGKILIKGKNEAGKSSIFEAIAFALFGEPVYVGTKSNLIRFNADKATIELTVKTEEKTLTIRRTLSKNTSQLAELRIKRTGENLPIVVSGVKNVDPRIIKEIGIDQDIFINTCFIGQKRLETLENLRAQERQELISKLFNLDYFINLLNKAKDIKKELITNKSQYEIIIKAAEAKKNLPLIKEEIENIHKRLEEIEKAEYAHTILKLEKTIQNLVLEIDHLEKEVHKLREDVELLEKCKEEEKLLNEINNTEEKISILAKQQSKILERINDLEKKITKEKEIKENIGSLEEIIKIKTQIEEINKAIIEEKMKISRTEELIPTLLEKVLRYKELEEKVSKEADLLEHLNRLNNEIQVLNSKIKKLKNLEEKLKNISQKINNLPKLIQDYKKAIEVKTKENLLISISKKLIKTRQKLNISLILLLLFASLSFLVNSLFLIPFSLLLILSIIFYKDLSKTKDEYKKEKNIIEFLQKESSIDTLIKKDLLILQKELKIIEEKEKVKREQIEKISQKIAQKLSDINPYSIIEERANLIKELQNINDIKKESENIIKDLANKLKSENNIKLIEEKISKAQEILEKKKAEISIKEKELENLKNLDPIPDKELTLLTSEKGSLENELKNIEILKKELEEQKRQYKQIEEQLKEEYLKLESLKQKVKSTDGEYIRKLRENIRTLEEKMVKERYEKLLSELNNKKGQKQSIEKEYNEYILYFQTTFSKDNWKDYLIIEIDQKEKELLENKEKELLQKLGEIESILREYENKTGKNRDELIPEKIEEEYRNIEKNIQKMEYVIKITESTRESILKSVLPRTMAYMQKFLPILTSDRYHYAEIDENYKLKVYTSENNTPLEKNIFSGGTQDQLSLALRLSFAMATLPQDKGVQPKFIFLDEPLGSFDEDRARGLLYLLTQGEVAEFFDQIFVVTHVPIDEELFDEIYYVDNGKIVKINKEPNLNSIFEDTL